MIKPDVIVVQPTNTDFPYWRHQMEKYRPLFNKVIIVFSETWRNNIQKQLTERFAKFDATVIPPRRIAGNQDWRTECIKDGLKHVSSDYLLFLEQDFIFKNDRFLEVLLNSDADLAGEKEGGDEKNRIHPCCILAKTNNVRSTSLDFAPQYPLDHFGKISLELQKITPYTSFKSLGLTDGEDYEHMAGLTHNLSLVTSTGKPNYRLDVFKAYNQMILDMGLDIVPEFRKVIETSAKIEI